MFQNAGKKVNGTPLPTIRRENEPISNVGMGHMTMIDLLSSERRDEKADKYAYV
jgi:hypothetical protein